MFSDDVFKMRGEALRVFDERGAFVFMRFEIERRVGERDVPASLVEPYVRPCPEQYMRNINSQVRYKEGPKY